MAKEKLALLSLKTLDRLGEGTLETDFANTLQALVKDCMERPGIEKKREVALVFILTPVVKSNGTCDDVTVHAQVTSKCPAKVCPEYTMRTTVNGGLRFAPLTPGNPDQAELDLE